MIKHFLNPPNWFTSASVFCSIYAMSLLIAAPDPVTGQIAPEVLSRACVLVIFGGIFDLLDGRVARMTRRFSEFGVQLDTIADMVGFGVAPALIAWTWALKDMGPVGVAITFWYVLCAAFRLARFNVDSTDQVLARGEGGWNLAGHTQGLTTTMAGGSLVTLIWVSNGYLAEAISVPGWAVGLLVASLGCLMISSIPYRNFKDLRQNKLARRLLAVSLACCLAGAVVLDPSMWWGVGAALYLSIGLADGLIVAAHSRIIGKALLIDEIEEALAESDEEELEESSW